MSPAHRPPFFTRPPSLSPTCFSMTNLSQQWVQLRAIILKHLPFPWLLSVGKSFRDVSRSSVDYLPPLNWGPLFFPVPLLLKFSNLLCGILKRLFLSSSSCDYSRRVWWWWALLNPCHSPGFCLSLKLRLIKKCPGLEFKMSFGNIFGGESKSILYLLVLLLAV